MEGKDLLLVCSKHQGSYDQAMSERLGADGGGGVLQEAMQVLGG